MDKEKLVPATQGQEEMVAEREATPPAFKAEHDALDEESQLLHEMISARKGSGLKQSEVAERMGTKASAIARLEAVKDQEKRSPSISTLRKYAHAIGGKIRVSLELDEQTESQDKSNAIDSYLATSSVRSCENYCQIFSKEAKDQTNLGHKTELELLRDVTSLLFNFDKFSEDFSPLFVNFGGLATSFSMKDLDDSKMLLLTKLLNETEDFELRARISDVLQSQVKKDRLYYAEISVDSYLSCIEKNHYSCHEYLERVKRVSQIAIKFVKGAKRLSERVINFFDVAIQLEVEKKAYYSAIELLGIFAQSGLMEPIKKEQYRVLCLKLIAKLEESEMWRAAEKGYEIAIEYFSTYRQKKSLLVNFAKLCENIANLELSIQKLNYLRKAIGLYRTAGSAVHKDVVEILESQLSVATKQFWEAKMKQFSVNADATNIVKSIEHSLLNTSIKDKIVQLSAIDAFLDKNEAVYYIKQLLQGSFLKSAITEIYDSNFSLQYTSRGADSDDFAQEFFILKASRYSQRAAFIEHIRVMIMKEHNPALHDLEYLYENSPWVPAQHKEQIGRGIYFGFCGDWMACGLFLLPIIEVMLGAFLASKGQSTIKCNKDSTQENRSLSELLSKPTPDTIKILGDKIPFELSFLLIDNTGFKLRHRSSHGGLSDSEYSADGVKIVWWVIIKLLLELN